MTLALRILLDGCWTLSGPLAGSTKPRYHYFPSDDTGRPLNEEYRGSRKTPRASTCAANPGSIPPPTASRSSIGPAAKRLGHGIPAAPFNSRTATLAPPRADAADQDAKQPSRGGAQRGPRSRSRGKPVHTRPSLPRSRNKHQSGQAGPDRLTAQAGHCRCTRTSTEHDRPPSAAPAWSPSGVALLSVGVCSCPSGGCCLDRRP